uniref:Uncharacterized protein n=1 Tax=Heterorhabditis bacteriophora TaxID=37862 RepID=A0A1I7XQY8_HETBA
MSFYSTETERSLMESGELIGGGWSVRERKDPLRNSNNDSQPATVCAIATSMHHRNDIRNMQGSAGKVKDARNLDDSYR